MNTVLDPSLLWISSDDWYDEKKRDLFLDHLLRNLEAIDDYKISKIVWTDELEEQLWGDPQLPPWRVSEDWKNPIIPLLNKFFVRNRDIVDADTFSECCVHPPLNHNYGKHSVIPCFMKLMHFIIDSQQDFYFCLGIDNTQPIGTNYSFSCDCHDEPVIPELINSPTDWDRHFNLEDYFWPSTIEDVDLFKKALEITARTRFARDSFSYRYYFTNDFIEELIDEDTHRSELLFSISKRLLLTQSAASRDTGLNDEPKRGERGIRRFRVSGEGRIHYKYDTDGSIIFLNYFGDGQHDDGL